MFWIIANAVKRASSTRTPELVAPPATRVLIPVAGGPNATAALGILPGLAAHGHEITFLHVRRPGAGSSSVLAQAMKATSGLSGANAREVRSESPASAIIEASQKADLLVLGASGNGLLPVSNPALSGIIERSACPTIVVRARTDRPRAGRDGPRALVVAESSPAGIAGLERALQAARTGSSVQHVLLGPAPRGEREDPDRRKLRITSGSSWTVAAQPLDAGLILGSARAGNFDLLVLAVETQDLGRKDGWVDEVVGTAGCAVACAFASRVGPATRRRRQALASV